MIPPLHLQALAETSAVRLVECLIEGTLITLCAALALRLRRQHNSGARFAVWFSVLMAIAAMPLLGSVLSAIQFPRSVAAPVALQHSAITLPASWALYLFAAWAILALLSLSRVVVSLYHVHALRKSCSPINLAQLDPLIHETLIHETPSETLRLRKRNAKPTPAALCTSAQVRVPTAIGFFKPAVVIPDWLLADLSPKELNQILLHELAHLRRRDDWTNLVQKIVAALFFFHPAVWWIEKKLSIEREMACDDAVLAATAQPRAYAECLTHLAEKTFIRHTLIRQGVALAQAALGRVRNTSLRVAQILDPKRPPASRHAWKPALSLVVFFAAGAVVFAAKEPHWIAFQDASSARAPLVATVVAPAGNPALRPIPASFTTPFAPARLASASVHRSLTKTTHLQPAARTSNQLALNQTSPKQLAPKQLALKQPAPNQLMPNQTAVAAPPLASAVNPTLDSAFVFESLIANPTLVHLTGSSDASRLSIQTVFLLVEVDRSDSGQAIYQFQLLRIQQPLPAHASGKTIPRKET
jgi:beta-lactamase regulating signal transducer with metallopeptidase domain